MHGNEPYLETSRRHQTYLFSNKHRRSWRQKNTYSSDTQKYTRRRNTFWNTAERTTKKSAETTASKNLIRSQLLLSSKEDLITQSLMWYTSGTMVYHGILCFLSGIIEQIKVHLTGSDGFMRCFEMMPSSMVRPAASMAVVAMTSLAGVWFFTRDMNSHKDISVACKHIDIQSQFDYQSVA